MSFTRYAEVGMQYASSSFSLSDKYRTFHLEGVRGIDLSNCTLRTSSQFKNRKWRNGKLDDSLLLKKYIFSFFSTMICSSCVALGTRLFSQEKVQKNNSRYPHKICARAPNTWSRSEARRQRSIELKQLSDSLIDENQSSY